MARETKTQKKKVQRVMREYKRGQLKSGGSGRKVKTQRQAVAIALREAGVPKKRPSSKSARRPLAKTKTATRASSARGRAGTSVARARVAKKTSTRASAGRATPAKRSARTTASRSRTATPRSRTTASRSRSSASRSRTSTTRGRSTASRTRATASRGRGAAGHMPSTKAELYREAKRRDIQGRSRMSKSQLARAVRGR